MAQDKPPNNEFKTLRQKQIEEAITAYGFLAPAVIIFLIFLVIPIGFALLISFTDWNGISPLGQTAEGATGEVEFTNLTDEPITISAGTIVLSGGSEPLEFATLADAELPAGEGNTILVEVQAVDDSLGIESNTATGRINTVTGDLEGSVEVINPLPVAGGRDDAYEFVGLNNYQRLLAEQGLAQRRFLPLLEKYRLLCIGSGPNANNTCPCPRSHRESKMVAWQRILSDSILLPVNYILSGDFNYLYVDVYSKWDCECGARDNFPEL